MPRATTACSGWLQRWWSSHDRTVAMPPWPPRRGMADPHGGARHGPIVGLRRGSDPRHRPGQATGQPPPRHQRARSRATFWGSGPTPGSTRPARSARRSWWPWSSEQETRGSTPSSSCGPVVSGRQHRHGGGGGGGGAPGLSGLVDATELAGCYWEACPITSCGMLPVRFSSSGRPAITDPGRPRPPR